MAAHEHYKALCNEYRRLSFTEQMRICGYLYRMAALTNPTMEELDEEFFDYMLVNGYIPLPRDIEVFYV